MDWESSGVVGFDLGPLLMIHICPLKAYRHLTLKLFIEGHPQTAKVPHQGHFWPLMH